MRPNIVRPGQLRRWQDSTGDTSVYIVVGTVHLSDTWQRDAWHVFDEGYAIYEDHVIARDELLGDIDDES